MTQRIALVTGGIGGLGSAICRRLAESGRSVVAADLEARGEAVEGFLAESRRAGADVAFEPVDVSSHESCTSLVARVGERIGPIDIVVNAAGITRDVTLRKMEPAQWNDVLRVNLDGVFNVCRAVVAGMCDRGFGRIVNISSVNGQTGQFGQTNYSAAKAGMHGFTMALAREVARKGVTVNSVSPGYFRTAMVMAIPDGVREDILAKIPVGRFGEPSEVARVVEFLAADDAGYITGQNVGINGGYFMDF